MKKKICISEKVKEEMARLREKPLVSCVPCLYNNDQPSRIKVLFHNVRSLRLHFDDIKCDYNVQAADINIFVETRLCHSDNNAIYEIDNFSRPSKVPVISLKVEFCDVGAFIFLFVYLFSACRNEYLAMDTFGPRTLSPDIILKTQL